MHLLCAVLVACSCLTLCLATRQDYERVGDYGRYRYSSTKKTWDEAQAECESEGGYLVVLDTQGEAAKIKEFYNQKRGSNDGIYTLIGFHDKDTEGKYMTVRGKQLQDTGYNVWKYPPTNSQTNEVRDCGGMYICGRYTDMSCTTTYTFICELLGEVEAV